MAELIGQLARAEREGRLLKRIHFFAHPSLLIVDEISYLYVVPRGSSLSVPNLSAPATKTEP